MLKEYIEYKDMYEEAQENLEETEDKLEQCQSKLDQQTKLVRDLESRLYNAGITLSSQQKICDELNASNNQLKGHLTELEEMRIKYTQLQSAYNAVMEQNKSLTGKIDNFKFALRNIMD